ncbi:phage portal protein, HK97 family [Brevibacillus sp. CF112]|uniref:phage portal protein n=1 Tax=Brevibacillus TaxID=55080 RepID=UPI000271BB80|nr:phage portal protein [Brevibacillus sp. CF112]EJL44019.1 phage portal protein, HK97 family [Brevibacillus sp. CF112]
MSKKQRQKARQPTAHRSVSGGENTLLGYWFKGDDLTLPTGYIRLSENPEVRMAVDRIADMVSNMTIHLMRNVEGGHERVQNELSRKVDIEPYSLMTRKSWLYYIVHTILLEGDGNAVVFPEFRAGLIEELIPVPAHMVTFSPPIQNGVGLATGYQVMIQGRIYNHDEVLHFKINPDPQQPWIGRGYRLILKDVVANLAQAAKTKNAFMGDKWRPSVIVMVDADSSQFASEEERDKLIERYIGSGQSGKPWILPEGMIRIDTVKPLTLEDIAIHESVQIDKRTVAAILGVPPFFVGVGEFKKDEVNNFIRTRIASIATVISQELTSKLLYSPDLYFRLSARSLYAYDLNELAKIGMEMFVRGLMDGNEVRDWVGLSPRDGLDELVILENYIPRGMIGDQKKLEKAGDDG